MNLKSQPQREEFNQNVLFRNLRWMDIKLHFLYAMVDMRLHFGFFANEADNAGSLDMNDNMNDNDNDN